MEIYAQIALKIIEQQELIIGPVAIEQAENIDHLHINWGKREVSIDGNGPDVIDELVKQYKVLFGQISVEVCRDAASKLLINLPSEQRPSLLK